MIGIALVVIVAVLVAIAYRLWWLERKTVTTFLRLTGVVKNMQKKNKEYVHVMQANLTLDNDVIIDNLSLAIRDGFNGVAMGQIRGVAAERGDNTVYFKVTATTRNFDWETMSVAK